MARGRAADGLAAELRRLTQFPPRPPSTRDRPPDEPLVLKSADQERLAELPKQEDLVFELIAPVVPASLSSSAGKSPEFVPLDEPFVTAGSP